MRQFAVGLLVLLLTACATEPASIPFTAVGESPAAKKDLTIALLGATGMVGGFVLREALAQGYDVRALARTPRKLDTFKDRISIVQGDARDSAAIDALLTGSDVVISALGPVRGDGDAARMISTTATGHIINLMQKHAIERYIVVSGAGVDAPGDERNFTGWLMQKMVGITLRSTLQDKQAEYQLLAASNIAWTAVRCPVISAHVFEHPPRASLATPSAYSLRAGELARFIIEQIPAQEFVGQAPFLDSR